MNRLMADMMAKHTPKVNDEIMGGIATKYMTRVEQYLDSLFKSIARSSPEGLEYEGYHRCTPMEEYREATKLRDSRRTFNIAHSSLYMVGYKFSFKGEEIATRYVSLPYVDDSGMMFLGGTRYQITPVLSDKVITPTMGNIFVRLIRDKITFRRLLHTVVVDDEIVNQYVMWVRLYRRSPEHRKRSSTTRANVSGIHYLFAKYGFSGVFERYTKATPVVGTEKTITRENYPKEDWVIYSSNKIAPPGYMSKFYKPSDIVVAVRRSEYTDTVKSILTAFFYTVDHFPSRFKPEYVDSPDLWIILLGNIILSGEYGENKLYNDMMDHLNVLDDFMDSIIIEKLRETGREVETFYDLIMLISNEYNDLILDSQNTINSIYGKTLEVLYHVLYDVFSGLIRVNYRLNKIASRRELRISDINDALYRNFTTGAIFKLTRNNVIATPVSYSGDHKFFKITGKITEQENVSQIGGRSRRKIIDDDKKLDISMIETGNLLHLPDSNPTPINFISPFVTIEPETGTVIPNPEHAEVLESTKNKF